MHRVMIVDDEPAVLTALQLAFEEDGRFEVRTALSAEDALASLAREPAHLVITDKNLPGASGLDLARKLRADQQTVRIVLITGYSTLESQREGESLRLDAYLEKPFTDIYEVPRLAERLLGSARA